MSDIGGRCGVKPVRVHRGLVLATLIAVVCPCALIGGCRSNDLGAYQASRSVEAHEFSAFLEETRPGMTTLVEGHKTLAAAAAALASGDAALSAAETSRAARLYDAAAAELSTVRAPDAIKAYGPYVATMPGLAGVARRKARILRQYDRGRLTSSQAADKIQVLQQETAGKLTAYTSAGYAWNAELAEYGVKMGLHPPEWLLELSREAIQAQGTL